MDIQIKTLPHADSDAGSDSAADAASGNSGAAGTPQYLQLVISASYDLVERSRQEIIDLCLRELGEVLPAVREAKLEKATVIKEVHATFSPEPGVDAWRPPQQIGLENLFVAGRLDSNWLAFHDGRRGTQRLSGGGSGAFGIRTAAKLSETGFAF